MAISLRTIDKDNFTAVIKLNVSEAQRGYVAPNVYSIAESVPYPYLVPRAIYSDEEPVGFALYGREPDDGGYWIVRFMIDASYQGKGLGKASLVALIDTMKTLSGCVTISLSYMPGNKSAEALYTKVGFVATGETDDTGEIIMRYTV